VVKRTAWFLLAYAILLVVSLPYLIPPIPKTKLGWLVLLALGPPGYLLLSTSSFAPPPFVHNSERSATEPPPTRDRERRGRGLTFGQHPKFSQSG
jgi:hypothetical protein